MPVIFLGYSVWSANAPSAETEKVKRDCGREDRIRAIEL
jgi:hypothetical protein